MTWWVVVVFVVVVRVQGVILRWEAGRPPLAVQQRWWQVFLAPMTPPVEERPGLPESPGRALPPTGPPRILSQWRSRLPLQTSLAGE